MCSAPRLRSIGVGFPLLQGSSAPLFRFFSSFFPTSKAVFYCFLWPSINAVTQSCRRSTCVCVCVCVDTLQALYPPLCLSTRICVWPGRVLKSEPHQNRPRGCAERRTLMKLYTSGRVITYTHIHTHTARRHKVLFTFFLGHSPSLYKETEDSGSSVVG